MTNDAISQESGVASAPETSAALVMDSPGLAVAGMVFTPSVLILLRAVFRPSDMVEWTEPCRGFRGVGADVAELGRGSAQK